jgi:hypothetical protein
MSCRKSKRALGLLKKNWHVGPTLSARRIHKSDTRSIEKYGAQLILPEGRTTTPESGELTKSVNSDNVLLFPVFGQPY